MREDVECMDSAVKLAEYVFGMDEGDAVGYVIDRALPQVAAGASFYGGLIEVRDALEVAKELDLYHREQGEARYQRERERVLAEHIRNCGLSARAESALLRNNVKTLAEARELGYDGLMQIRGIGPKAAEEILMAADVMIAERLGDA